MSRDARASTAHWNRMLASKERSSYSSDPFEWYRGALERKPEDPRVHNLYRMAVGDWLEGVNHLYSRGDPLDDIRSRHVVRALDNAVVVAGELERYRDRLDKRYFHELLSEPHELHELLAVLSWLVCFETDPDKIGRIAPCLAPAGEDRLIDTVLQRYQPDRVVADGPACARTFGPLDEIVLAGEAERVKLVRRYLDSWAVRMATLDGLRSIGTANAHGATSNASLEEESRVDDGYKGFWAWEAALVVRFFEIDDSSFRGHVLYPEDLAHHRFGEEGAER